MNIRRKYSGFTIVELMVVIALVGVLVGLLLPAVLQSREMARKLKCQSNLHNVGLAILNYESAHLFLPPGSNLLDGTEHAWSSQILPFLEQEHLANEIDWTAHWNEPGPNSIAAETNLKIYRCPSALKRFNGKCDYGGIFGTTLVPLPLGMGPNSMFGCGAIVLTNPEQPFPTNFPSFEDGIAYTIMVGESIDRDSGSSGRWASGQNCFAQVATGIDSYFSGGLFSRHPTGANVVFADGSVRFIEADIQEHVLGALCTRNGDELVTFEN